MKQSFRETINSMVPPWLSVTSGRAVGARLLYAFAALCDAGIQFAVEGVQARYPGIGTPTAYPYLSRDRRIIRGPGVPDAAFAVQLEKWLDSHRGAGSPVVLLEQLAGALVPYQTVLRFVDTSGNWWTRNIDGTYEVVQTYPTSNWNWDSRPDLWARGYVIIYGNAIWQPMSAWGTEQQWNGVWGDTTSTWGTTATTTEIETMIHVIQQWSAGHCLIQWLIIAFDDASFSPTNPLSTEGMPDGLWGKWHKVVGGVAVKARLSSARYVEVK